MITKQNENIAHKQMKSINQSEHLITKCMEKNNKEQAKLELYNGVREEGSDVMHWCLSRCFTLSRCVLSTMPQHAIEHCKQRTHRTGLSRPDLPGRRPYRQDPRCLGWCKEPPLRHAQWVCTCFLRVLAGVRVSEKLCVGECVLICA